MQTAKVVKKIEKIKLTPISPSEKFKKSSYCILMYNLTYYKYALGSYRQASGETRSSNVIDIHHLSEPEELTSYSALQIFRYIADLCLSAQK